MAVRALADKSANLKALRRLDAKCLEIVRLGEVGLAENADDEDVVRVAGENGLVVLTGDRGEEMTSRLKGYPHGAIVFYIRALKWTKAKKHYEKARDTIPQTKADCNLAGMTVHAHEDRIEVLDSATGRLIDSRPYRR